MTRNNKKKQKETGEVAELVVSEHQQVFSRAHTVELIVLDVSRTFPSLCIFQEVRVMFVLVMIMMTYQ